MAMPVTEQTLANPRILAYLRTYILAEKVQYEYDFVDGKAEMYQQSVYMGVCIFSRQSRQLRQV